MFTQKILIFLFSFQSLLALPSSFREQFKEVGFVEICDSSHGLETFDSLYAYFDDFIDFLQSHTLWTQKLYCAKERFLRSRDKNSYSTDFFGYYDESKKDGRNQISFYYASHFHQFLCSYYPEIQKIPEINRFFEACNEIQKSYRNLLYEIAKELDVEAIFSSTDGFPPILFKVIKYFPSYKATIPHYDGTAFSLFLDSTDNESLLLSPYKLSFVSNDFTSPVRKFPRSCNQTSLLVIPGTLLTEFLIYPTPHIVTQSGKNRYATIAFAMRPNFHPQKIEFSSLPNFKH